MRMAVGAGICINRLFPIFILLIIQNCFLFFPGKNQSDDPRIALSAFCHMIALEVEVEDEILSGIQRLASLADPILAVASCQLYNLRSDVL